MHRCRNFLLCFLMIPMVCPAQVRQMNPPTGEGSGMYFLSGSPQGNVHLSWLERHPPNLYELRFSTFTGGAWNPPKTIAAGDALFANWGEYPSIAELPDGSLAAQWLVFNRSIRSGTTSSLRIARSADGGAHWKELFRDGVELTNDYSGFASLLPSSAGLAASYLSPSKSHASQPGHVKTLKFVTFRPNGAVARDVVVDPDVCTCCGTATAETVDGPVIVYRDHLPGEIRDISIIRFHDGSWTQPQPVYRDGWVINACPTDGPAIAASGKAVAVAWFTRANDVPKLQVAFSQDSGGRFASPSRVDAGNPLGRADIQTLDDGDVAVSWLERVADDMAELRLRRVTPEGKLGRAVIIGKVPAGRSVGFPRIVRRNGDLIVAWRTNRVVVAMVSLASL